MITGSPSNLEAVANAPHTSELLLGRSNLRFSPEVEREYIRAHLLESRVLIRVTCVLGTLLALVRGVEQLTVRFVTDGALMALGSVTAASLLLTCIAWSPVFERLFLPFARVIVPARNATVAACIAAAAAHGQVEMLMFLPIILIGPFFFMGLEFRAALLSGVLTTASFITHTVLFELPLAIGLRACAFVLISLVACAVAARHLEKFSRASFLESRLIAQLAQHDTLTGTKNRRVFDEHLARLWPEAGADSRTLAILLIDVDHFKAYNDHYGHQAGDQTLRQIAQSMQASVRRPLDMVSRYGGEEFATVLYDVGIAQAKDIADRMRRAVQELNIEHRGSRTSPVVTISVGVAFITPTLDRTPRGAMQLADQALYEAKIRGRNRVELMNESDYGMLVTGVFAKKSQAGTG